MYSNAELYLPRYMRELAAEHRSITCMLSLDDKCKVNVGEPNFPVAAVSRGRRVSLLHLLC